MMARALITDLPRRPSDAGRCPDRIAIGLCAVYTARARAVSIRVYGNGHLWQTPVGRRAANGRAPLPKLPQDRGGQAAARSGTLGPRGPTDMTPRGHHEG